MLRITLTPDQEVELAQLVRHSPSHRIRQRSQALLWSHQGKNGPRSPNSSGLKSIPSRPGFIVGKPTRLPTAWLMPLVAADAPKSTKAKKTLMQQLGPAVVNLRHWLANQPWLPSISPWTLKRLLKQAGFRWKQVRKSLKGQQDAVLMVFFKEELADLLQAHQQGELPLWFYDETGLGLNPTGLQTWQAPDSRVSLPAQRGEGFCCQRPFS